VTFAKTATPTESVSTKLAWILVAAVAALVVNEVVKAIRSKRDVRQRDQAVLSALLRETAAIKGLVSSIQRDLLKEEEALRTSGKTDWRLKPLAALPTTIYDLVKTEPPSALLDQTGALSDLMRLQTQCAYTNALAQQQLRWKGPAAEPGMRAFQGLRIETFLPAIMESVNVVGERAERVSIAVRVAGEQVGGLNLEGAPD
jgi:hypothetical protein